MPAALIVQPSVMFLMGSALRKRMVDPHRFRLPIDAKMNVEQNRLVMMKPLHVLKHLNLVVVIIQVVIIKVANQLVLMMGQAIATKIITRTFQHLILVLNLLHARNVYLQLNVNGPMDFCF